MSVHERMIAVLGEMPPLGKDSRNQQQGFMFRSFDAMQNALNPLLAKHGVFVVPRVLERVTGQRQTRNGGTMFEVNLHVEFTFYGADGDSVAASTWGEGTDSGDKATSKAHTMALKTVLNEVFAISNEEFADPDGQTAEETNGRTSPFQPPKPKPQPKITADQKDQLKQIAERLVAAEHIRPEQLDSAVGGTFDKRIEELTEPEAGDLIKRLETYEQNLAAVA